MINGTFFRGQQVVRHMRRQAAQIDRAQQQIATTQKRIRPSDDPVGYTQSIRISRRESDNNAWEANLHALATDGAHAETAMASMSNALQRAHELMIRGNNDTNSASDRAAIATEVEALIPVIEEARATRNSSGGLVFSPSPLLVPVGNDQQLSGTISSIMIFDSVRITAGQASISSILRDAGAALRTTDPLARRSLLSAGLGQVDAADRHVVSMRSVQGVIGQRIDERIEQLAASKQIDTEEKSRIDGADIGEAVIQQQAYQLARQATQASFTRSWSRTLFDLLG